MSYTTIYYYGLLTSFVINLFVLYANIYHNDDIKKTDYKNMLIGHYILLITSWVGVILYILSLFWNIKEHTNKPRRK